MEEIHIGSTLRSKLLVFENVLFVQEIFISRANNFHPT